MHTSMTLLHSDPKHRNFTRVNALHQQQRHDRQNLNYGYFVLDPPARVNNTNLPTVMCHWPAN